MAVNLTDSSDIQIVQTGNNIELQIDSDIKNEITQNTSNIADAQQDITNLENGNVYSTNEVNTGKIWIDNKPIYRRVFDNVTLPRADKPTTTTIAAIPNISKLVGYTGILITNGGIQYTGYASTSVYISPYIDASGNLKTIHQFYSETTKGRVIIEYTKTTD